MYRQGRHRTREGHNIDSEREDRFSTLRLHIRALAYKKEQVRDYGHIQYMHMIRNGNGSRLPSVNLRFQMCSICITLSVRCM